MDLRDIEEAARDQGFGVDRTARGHPKFLPPDRTKGPVFGSGTPGDQRAIRNLLAKLRAAGLIWPPGRRPRRKKES